MPVQDFPKCGNYHPLQLWLWGTLASFYPLRSIPPFSGEPSFISICFIEADGRLPHVDTKYLFIFCPYSSFEGKFGPSCQYGTLQTNLQILCRVAFTGNSWAAQTKFPGASCSDSWRNVKNLTSLCVSQLFLLTLCLQSSSNILPSHFVSCVLMLEGRPQTSYVGSAVDQKRFCLNCWNHSGNGTNEWWGTSDWVARQSYKTSVEFWNNEAHF